MTHQTSALPGSPVDLLRGPGCSSAETGPAGARTLRRPAHNLSELTLIRQKLAAARNARRRGVSAIDRYPGALTAARSAA